jgi:PST family polysaccharide transporter
MRDKIQNTKKLILNNKKVIENYFFMTVLQVLNSLFYLLIYPFLIRVLGAESYGLYVFGMSIVTYFIYFVSFGFDMPAMKSISQNKNNQEIKERTLSCVFTAKVYLLIVFSVFFLILVLFIDRLRAEYGLYSVLYLNVIVNIIFPQWYYQGVQKMNVVTIIQLLFKLFSLPLIFVFIRNVNDVFLYAVIITSVNISGALTAAWMLKFVEKINLHWMKFPDLKVWYMDALPFFWSSVAGTIKDQGVVVIVGVYFGLSNVAIFDLANKIVMLPKTLLMSVNSAFFPKIMADYNNSAVKRIIRFEYLISFTAICLIIISGRWIVLFMGGVKMLDAYPMTILLSSTILSTLVVNAIIYFIFIPNNKYYFVPRNQLVSLVSFLIYCGIGMFFSRNILVFGCALALSTFTELIYCKVLTRRIGL